VAPGPDTLATALDELERRLVIAEALGRASARWQNQRQPGDRTCDGTASPYVHVAEAWHDAAQRARTQQDRVRWLWDAPTLADVRTDDLVARWYVLDERADEASGGWMVFRSWHQRYGPRCKRVPPLVPVAPRGPSEPDVHAVWLLEGTLCPDPGAPESSWTLEVSPIDGAGIHLVAGPVCAAPDRRCACEPRPTRPGEILVPD
jgi:hypothetical protein